MNYSREDACAAWLTYGRLPSEGLMRLWERFGCAEAIYEQFSEGKKGTLFVVKNQAEPKENEINAVTGATITSKTITKGANCALEIATTLMESEAE